MFINVWQIKDQQMGLARNMRNTWVKKKCFLAHKTMVKAIEKRSKEFIKSMERICAKTLVVKEKWLEYLKVQNKKISWNQMVMVWALTI